ncbi:MAG: hypothetical protein JJE51_09415 [Thermoanaerobaculia bacterium]|nr:hypothetical protein [Thermoanaerobaculia bacterium]
MKTKLTITIDKELLPRAKAYARESGISLSEVIETALRELSSETQNSFSSRWRGALELSGGGDERRRRLLKKYS